MHDAHPQLALDNLLKQLNEGGIEEFEILETIGEGSFGKVKKAKRKNGEIVAIKLLSKSQVNETESHLRVLREIAVLHKLSHPRIAKLLQVTSDDLNIYLILEFAAGGELYGYLNSRGRLQEDEAQYYLKHIVDAVDYCHQLKVVHRDLKLENCLLSAANESIKLIGRPHFLQLSQK